MTDTIAVGLLSGFTGALAGLFGTLYIGTKQIKATTVTANREKWICELRDELASALTRLQLLQYASTTPGFLERADVRATIEALHLSEVKIRLMTNPNEADHVRLVTLLQTSINAVGRAAEPQTGNDNANQLGEIVTASQVVLKREWERVKRGE